MAFVDLTKNTSNPTNGKDQVVFKKRIAFLDGGRSLDVTGVTEKALYAGHIIVKDTTTGEFKPVTVSGENFEAAAEGTVIVGILADSIFTDKAFASILVAAVINEKAMPYKLPEAVKTALKTACPSIILD